MHAGLRFLQQFAATVAILGCSLPALAALGGGPSSIDADQAHMNATTQVTHSMTYDIHAVRSPAGTVVDEYLSPAGKVVAVAWQGQFMPDMRQILGAYYQQYSAALQGQAAHYGHHPLNIHLPGLVIQTGGHMRAYFGRVYIPAMLPEGLQAAEIR